jgi:hypothetical protein
MARKSKKKAVPASIYDDLSITVLRHAHEAIAGTVYPLPDGADADEWRAAIDALEKLGLLHTGGAEPALTVKGHNVCVTLARRGWRWP